MFSFADRQTDGQMDNSKTIWPRILSYGGIKNKKNQQNQKPKTMERHLEKILIHVPTSAKPNGTCKQTRKYSNLQKNARFLRQWKAWKAIFFKWIHLTPLTTISKIILPRKFKKDLVNICEDIPVTFDSSSYKNLTDDNLSDNDYPVRYIPCYTRVFSFQVFNFQFHL